MVFGCFLKFGVGNLVQIDGRTKYVNILSENLTISAEKMNSGSFVLQQDNDPKHTSRLATLFLKKTLLKN